MNKEEIQDFVDDVMIKVTEMASEKDLTNEEFLLFLSKMNERVSDHLSYFLAKALSR